MKFYSDVTGPELEALIETFRVTRITTLAGCALLASGAVFSGGRLGGVVLLVSGALLLYSGWVYAANRDGMASEWAARLRYHFRLWEPNLRWFPAQRVARLGGAMLFSFGLIAGLTGISIMFRDLPLIALS